MADSPAPDRTTDEGFRWSPRVQRHTETIAIAATPQSVYDRVADLTKVDELSPEIQRAEWIGEPAAAVAGARLRGYNRWRGFRWSRDVVVEIAIPGEQLQFSTIPGRGIYHDTTRWRYVLQPMSGGTQVTESYEFRAPEWLRSLDVLLGRPHSLAHGMRRTLVELKAATEQRRS